MSVLTNPNQEKFCHNYLKYLPELNGWQKVLKESGYSTKNKQYYTNIANRPKIKGRILELQQESADKEVLSLRERLKLLTEFAKNEENKVSERMQALRDIHHQSGDDVVKSDLGLNGENILRFVDIKLPAKNTKNTEPKKVEPKTRTQKEKESLSSNYTVDDLLKDTDPEMIKQIDETIATALSEEYPDDIKAEDLF